MASAAPPVALIVEDDEAIREVLMTALDIAGFAAVTAEHGGEALDYLERAPSPPRVIVLDLMMPVVDGWEFLERRAGPHRELPVIVLSAKRDPAVPPGITVLRKPVSLENLLAALAPIPR